MSYQPSDDSVERSRSYAFRRAVPVGAKVRATRGFYSGKPYAAGTTGMIISYTNAGFRGIEVAVRFPDGSWVHGVSAGIWEVVK